MSTLPPAGWYPDPADGGAQRYWTGSDWAPTQPSAATSVLTDPPQAMPAREDAAPSSAFPVEPGPRVDLAPRSASNSAATAALVLGILALALGLIPYLGFLTWILGVLAGVLGVVALRRPFLRGRAVAGLVLGLTGALVGLIISVAVVATDGSSTGAADDSTSSTDVVANSGADSSDTASIDAEKAQRADLVTQLETSIKKDAKKDVANGALEGPVLDVSCTPIGGSTDPLSDQSGTFTCLVATSKDADGTERGYDYSAAINWDSGAYTWKYSDD